MQGLPSELQRPARHEAAYVVQAGWEDRSVDDVSCLGQYSDDREVDCSG